MYEDLVKRLREYAKEHCPLDRGSGICGCIDARETADAIEELSKRVPKVPHGRPIDADDVNNHVLGYVDLRSCPTIIPASEEEREG